MLQEIVKLWKSVFLQALQRVHASNLRDLTAAKLPHPAGDTDSVQTIYKDKN